MHAIPSDTPPYENRLLFSKYYLTERLPNENFFKEVHLKELYKFSHFIFNLYSVEKENLPKYDEPDLESKWIWPILKELGHIYTTNSSIKNLEITGIKTPDFILYINEDCKNHCFHEKDIVKSNGAIAIGETKEWKVSLDGNKTTSNESATIPFETRSPHYQITFYIDVTGLSWGILTNGKKWRLYSSDKLYKLIYYEIDLEKLITERQSPNNLMYFLLFFRKDSFTHHQRGISILEHIKESSRELAIKIEEDIKEQAYAALRLLCQGFFDSNLDILKIETKETIQKHSLILLYRLLFIFYAESRNILPLDNPKYNDNCSLSKIRNEIRDLSIDPAAPTTLFWSRLQVLFGIINGENVKTNTDLGVPRYNGGLFSEEKHPFFKTYLIRDSSLVPIIRILSQSDLPENKLYDYSSLEINHLGTIYEGLLEYFVRIEREPYVGVIRDNKKMWIKKDDLRKGEGIKEEVAPNTFFLETHKGERKSTGSYYTPAEIVNYMVSKTIPHLFERLKKESVTDEKLDAAIYIQKILQLKILDLAMGSGHFLLEVGEQIAKEIMKYQKPDKIVSDDYLFYKYLKLSIENNIYGIDINEMAVELAKIAFWLAIAPLKEPPSCLDHRLKNGNSLFGINIDDINDCFPDKVVDPSKKQKLLVKDMDIEQNSGNTFLITKKTVKKAISDFYKREIENSKTWENQILEISPIKDVADFKLTEKLGNKVDVNLKEFIISEKYRVEKRPELQKIRKFFNEKDILRPFHWDIEFPFIFQSKNPGFDLVLGNPPYISFGLGRVGKLSRDISDYIRQQYPNSAEYKISWYAVFIEKAIKLTKDRGYFTYILPDSYLVGTNFSRLRRFLLKYKMYNFVHFKKNFWKDAEVGFPTILFVNKIALDKTHMIDFIKPSIPGDLIQDLPIHSVEENSFLIKRRNLLSDTGEIKAEDEEKFESEDKETKNNERYRFRFIEDSRSKIIIDKIEQTNLSFFYNYLEFHHGIRSRTGVGRSKIISVITPELEKDIYWKRGFIASDEIKQYLCFKANHLIHVDPSLLFSGGWEQTHIENPKILIRRTGDRLICALDENKIYHTNALIYSILNSRKISNTTTAQNVNLLKIFTSILNSTIFQLYYENVSMKKNRAMAQVEIDMLEEFQLCENIKEFTYQSIDCEPLIMADNATLVQHLNGIDFHHLFSLICKLHDQVKSSRIEILQKQSAFSIEKYLPDDRDKDEFLTIFHDEISNGTRFKIPPEINKNPDIRIIDLVVSKESRQNQLGQPETTVNIKLVLRICDNLSQLEIFAFNNVPKQKEVFLCLILPKLWQQGKIDLKSPTVKKDIFTRINTLKIPKLHDSDNFTPLWDLNENILQLTQRLEREKILLDKVIGFGIFGLSLDDVEYCLKFVDPLIY